MRAYSAWSLRDWLGLQSTFQATLAFGCKCAAATRFACLDQACHLARKGARRAAVPCARDRAAVVSVLLCSSPFPVNFAVFQLQDWRCTPSKGCS